MTIRRAALASIEPNKFGAYVKLDQNLSSAIHMNDSPSTTSWTYASLLAGGILIMVGGLAGPFMMGGFGGMMGYGMMGNYASYASTNWFAGFAWWMAIIGIVTGGIVLFAAYRFRQDPNDRTLVGTLAIIGGALSLLAMGGWILGAVLAILGGALALGAPNGARTNPPTHP